MCVVMEWSATLNGRYLNNTFYAKNVTHMHLVKDCSVLALVNRLIADVTESGWYSEFLGHTNQFGSWFVLQRYTNCEEKYKPFVTYVIFEETISGTIS